MHALNVDALAIARFPDEQIAAQAGDGERAVSPLRQRQIASSHILAGFSCFSALTIASKADLMDSRASTLDQAKIGNGFDLCLWLSNAISLVSSVTSGPGLWTCVAYGFQSTVANVRQEFARKYNCIFFGASVYVFSSDILRIASI
jgi:hypothetical protein